MKHGNACIINLSIGDDAFRKGKKPSVPFYYISTMGARSKQQPECPDSIDSICARLGRNLGQICVETPHYLFSLERIDIILKETVGGLETITKMEGETT